MTDEECLDWIIGERETEADDPDSRAYAEVVQARRALTKRAASKPLHIPVWIAVKRGEDRKFSFTAPPSIGWKRAVEKEGYELYRFDLPMPHDFNDVVQGDDALSHSLDPEEGAVRMQEFRDGEWWGLADDTNHSSA